MCPWLSGGDHCFLFFLLSLIVSTAVSGSVCVCGGVNVFNMIMENKSMAVRGCMIESEQKV